MTDQHDQPLNPVASTGNDDTALKVVAVHPAWHAAAVHLARHHLAHLQSYTYHPVEESEVEALLADVCNACGVDAKTAHQVAHELAQHVLPALIHGQPLAIVIVVADENPEPEHPDEVLKLLR